MGERTRIVADINGCTCGQSRSCSGYGVSACPAGGVYRPVVVIVPEAVEPPATPSTDQVTPPVLAVNCCEPVNVSTETRGLTENTAPLSVVAVATLENGLTLPAVSIA